MIKINTMIISVVISVPFHNQKYLNHLAINGSSPLLIQATGT
jgi:hypothetical protein